MPVPRCGSTVVEREVADRVPEQETGIIVTSPGSIIVARRTPKSALRQRKRKYANANATIALENVTDRAERR